VKLDPGRELYGIKIPEQAEDSHTAVFDGQVLPWFTLRVANMWADWSRARNKSLEEWPTGDSHPYASQQQQGVPVSL